MRRYIFASTALGLLAVAGAAHSQEARRMEIQLTARATYDDNVSRSGEALAALRGLEKEDIIYAPTASIDFLQPFGRQAVFLSGLVGYDFYDKNDQLNRERISLRGGVNTSLGPCRATVAGDFSRQQSQLDDLSPLVTENTETVTSASLEGQCGRQIGLAQTFGVTQTWAKNSADLLSNSDYTSTGGTLGVAYRRPTFGELAIFATANQTEFDRQVTTGGALEDDGYDLYGAGVRFSRRLGARIQAGATVSYTSVKPYASNVSDFKGVTYGADLTYRPSSRFDAAFAFIRAVEPSNRQDTSYQVTETISAQANYSLGSRIKLGVGGSYAEGAYEGGAVVPTVLSVTAEEIKTFSASVQFKASQRLSVTLDASQIERDANLRGFDYTANRVGLAIMASY